MRVVIMLVCLLVRHAATHGAFLGALALSLVAFGRACACAKTRAAWLSLLLLALAACVCACVAHEWARVRWLGHAPSLARCAGGAAALCSYMALLWVTFGAATAVAGAPRRPRP